MLNFVFSDAQVFLPLPVRKHELDIHPFNRVSDFVAPYR
jgi:hypothetical protein